IKLFKAYKNNETCFKKRSKPRRHRIRSNLKIIAAVFPQTLKFSNLLTPISMQKSAQARRFSNLKKHWPPYEPLQEKFYEALKGCHRAPCIHLDVNDRDHPLWCYGISRNGHWATTRCRLSRRFH